MYSKRFAREIQITQHAKQRMIEREISDSLLLDLIDTGTPRYKDATRLWLYKHYAERNDNLLCVAVVIENVLVVKTIMHHFEPE